MAKPQDDLVKALAQLGAAVTAISAALAATKVTASGGKPAEEPADDETDTLEDAEGDSDGGDGDGDGDPFGMEPETPKDTKKAVGKDDVLKAMRKVIDAADDEATGKKNVLAILKKAGGGAKNGTELDKKFYGSVHAALVKQAAK